MMAPAGRETVHPLNPSISIYILLTVVRIFLLVLDVRISLNIKTFDLW